MIIGIIFCSFLWSESNAGDSDIVFNMAIEELMKVNIEVASLFKEDDLVVGSTVELIKEEDWRRFGARRTYDAVKHLPSTQVMPSYGGAEAISIRGYAYEFSVRGVATLIDGVPVNTLSGGTAQYWMGNFDLAALDRIEMIRGPGSALYGSDAFHGVFSLKTFSSEEDLYAVNMEGGSRLYRQADVKVSRELLPGLRLNALFAHSGQPDQDIKYDYTNPVTGTAESGERANQYDSFTALWKLQSDTAADISAVVGARQRQRRLAHRSLFLSDQYLSAIRPRQ